MDSVNLTEHDSHHGPRRTAAEEQLNALTHALGCLLSCIGAIPLVNLAIHFHRRPVVAGTIAFCISMAAVYLVSTL